MNAETNNYQTSIDLEIKTYEIDAAGHVNNIVYIKWLEDLRCRLFSVILPVETLLNDKLYPVVTSTNINYKKQLKLGDKPTGYMQVDYIRHNVMNLKFKFTKDDKTCVYGEQKCVLMNLESGVMDKVRLKSLYTEPA